MPGLEGPIPPDPAGDQGDTPSGDAPTSATYLPGTQSPRSKMIHYFQQVLFMRRQRDKRFGQNFTTDRGWDLLLLLMMARLEERTMNAGDIFSEQNAHGITLEELERQIGFGNVILIEAGEGLARSQIVLSDEAARHLIDLFRIDVAAG